MGNDEIAKLETDEELRSYTNDRRGQRLCDSPGQNGEQEENTLDARTRLKLRATVQAMESHQEANYSESTRDNASLALEDLELFSIGTICC